MKSNFSKNLIIKVGFLSVVFSIMIVILYFFLDSRFLLGRIEEEIHSDMSAISKRVAEVYHSENLLQIVRELELVSYQKKWTQGRLVSSSGEEVWSVQRDAVVEISKNHFLKLFLPKSNSNVNFATYDYSVKQDLLGKDGNKVGALYFKSSFAKICEVHFNNQQTVLYSITFLLSLFLLLLWFVLLSSASSLINLMNDIFTEGVGLKINFPTYSNKDEIQTIKEYFYILSQSWKKLNLQTAKKSELETLGRISSQVAHDIGSPLAALNVAASSTSELSEEKRVLIRNAVARIRDIANSLVEKNREASQQAKGEAIEECEEPLSVQLLSSLIDGIMSEKRTQFRAKIDIEIEARFGQNAYGLFAKIQTIEFKRVLSNIINNAVEAIPGHGRVSVKLKSAADRKSIELLIADDGKGISAEVLPQLMQRGKTFGKSTGSGLGLYHTKTTIESWGGKVKINSTVDKGTVVTITLPKHPAPAWFVPKLYLSPGDTVVILDDDMSIHQIWDDRFKSLQLKEQQIQIKHMSTCEEVRKWCLVAKDQVVYLFDYELIGQQATGLQLIDDLGIKQQSILVTSRYEDAEILETCKKIEVKLIPKPMVGFVPVKIRPRLEEPAISGELKKSSPDLVLIDDDEIVHLAWQCSAKAANKIIKVYFSPKEFFREIAQFDKGVPIYIDSNLGGAVKGEDISKDLHERGFTNLYLATGYSHKRFPRLPWLQDIVGKEVPWQIAQ